MLFKLEMLFYFINEVQKEILGRTSELGIKLIFVWVFDLFLQLTET